jgi:hypothetical protein
VQTTVASNALLQSQLLGKGPGGWYYFPAIFSQTARSHAYCSNEPVGVRTRTSTTTNLPHLNHPRTARLGDHVPTKITFKHPWLHQTNRTTNSCILVTIVQLQLRVEFSVYSRKGWVVLFFYLCPMAIEVKTLRTDVFTPIFDLEIRVLIHLSICKDFRNRYHFGLMGV